MQGQCCLELLNVKSHSCLGLPLLFAYPLAPVSSYISCYSLDLVIKKDGGGGNKGKKRERNRESQEETGREDDKGGTEASSAFWFSLITKFDLSKFYCPYL